MNQDKLTLLLPMAREAVATFLGTLTGDERPVDATAGGRVSRDQLRSELNGRLVLVGRSGNDIRAIVTLDAQWLAILSTAMLGEAMNAGDEGADDLLKELTGQAYGAIRSHLATSGTTLPELSFHVAPPDGALPSASADVNEVSFRADFGTDTLSANLFIVQAQHEPAERASAVTSVPRSGASPNVSVAAAAFPELGSAGVVSGDGGNFELLAEVELEVTVELGRRRIPVADVLRLTTGSVIELEKLVGEPLEVYANGRLIAEGEAVVIDEQFGVRITNLVSSGRRAKAFI